jgi:hypothetical protein
MGQKWKNDYIPVTHFRPTPGDPLFFWTAPFVIESVAAKEGFLYLASQNRIDLYSFSGAFIEIFATVTYKEKDKGRIRFIRVTDKYVCAVISGALGRSRITIFTSAKTLLYSWTRSYRVEQLAFSNELIYLSTFDRNIEVYSLDGKFRGKVTDYLICQDMCLLHSGKEGHQTHELTTLGINGSGWALSLSEVKINGDSIVCDSKVQLCPSINISIDISRSKAITHDTEYGNGNIYILEACECLVLNLHTKRTRRLPWRAPPQSSMIVVDRGLLAIVSKLHGVGVFQLDWRNVQW